MKKISFLVATILFVLTLSGCSNETTIECYDTSYRVIITYNETEFVAVSDVYSNIPTEYTEEEVKETQDAIEAYYEGDTLQEVMEAFMLDADRQGATCEEK